MKKILIPIDFSGHTEITCKYAVEFAKSEAAELRFFHSYFDQIFLADSSFPDSIDMSTIYNEELLKEISHQADNKMKELKEKVEETILSKKLSDINITTVVTGGQTEDEVKVLLNDYKPDLVIVGTRGAGKNLNVWGKVSTFIVNHSGVPVITIPEIQRFLGFGKIMVAAGLKEDIANSIRKILELFQPFSAKVLCVHFLSKPKQKEEKEKMKLLQQQFEAEEKSGLISFEIREIEKDNQETVNRFINDFGITMIAFQPHRHGILFRLFSRKITKKNFFETNIPLLAIPVKKSRV